MICHLVSTRDLAKVEAAEGLKYLLNFYEFMALGTHVGDLDETLLYETISPSVVGWYTRSELHCKHVRSTPTDKLAYEHLDKLVNGYKVKIGGKEMEIDGWKKKLDLDKANSKLWRNTACHRMSPGVSRKCGKSPGMPCEMLDVSLTSNSGAAARRSFSACSAASRSRSVTGTPSPQRVLAHTCHS